MNISMRYVKPGQCMGLIEKQCEKLPVFVCLIGIFVSQIIDDEDLAEKY